MLDQKSTEVARAIQHHAPSAALIGISTNKCIDTIVQLLGILKAGKAYLPLDPDYPLERQAYMIEVSGLRHIVDDGSHAKHWTKLGLAIVPEKYLGQAAKPEVTPVDPLAAILFTSGSTGKPKGVMLTHQGLYSNLKFQTAYPCHGPGVKTLQYAHLAFDGAILEIFSALWTGGELHLMDDIQRLDNHQLLSYISEKGINRVFLPNVSLNTLAEEALCNDWSLDGLTEITTAGELLKTNTALKDFFRKYPKAYLKNAYGPTEASVCVTEWILGKSPEEWPDIPPIGRPLPDCQLWVLDDALNMVPDGEIGELYLSGICLAKGYINRPELTDEKFIFWMGEAGEIMRLYKTGDLALRDHSGVFHFKGRQDDQIKIRGNRVELGEVEWALAALEGIQQAVVKLDTDDFGQKFLSAFVKSSAHYLDAGRLKKQLRTTLPDYMVPEIILVVDDFPRTSSGKVDKNALPKARHIRPEWMAPLQSPANAAERNILTVFKGILMVNELSTVDNFFEFGGNSIKAQQTISQLRKLFGYEVPIAKLYQHPSVAALATFLARRIKPIPGKFYLERAFR
jgi:amino acid adenylation domain-containing protein